MRKFVSDIANPHLLRRRSFHYLKRPQLLLSFSASHSRFLSSTSVLDSTPSMAPPVTLDTINPKVFSLSFVFLIFFFPNGFDDWGSIGVSAYVFAHLFFFVSLSL